MDASLQDRLNVDVLIDVLSYTPVNHEDIIWLWTSARLVSCNFKEAAERVFLRRHLPKCGLFIDLGAKLFSERVDNAPLTICSM